MKNFPKKIKTLWLSDIHLGRPECQDKKLYDFLMCLKHGNKYGVEKIYLVGDIIDLTNFNYKSFFGKHLQIIKIFLDMANCGVEIIYILGNHEMPLQNLITEEVLNFNGIKIKKHDIHSTNGKKYLIIHGDQLDGFIRISPLLYIIGDNLYNIINYINWILNKFRLKIGLNTWSLSHWIKSKTKSAIKFISNFENLVVHFAEKYKVDGVISGHIHMPDDKMIKGTRYLNCGTWVEITSLIYEDYNGNIILKIL